jgi:hypothetical protein
MPEDEGPPEVAAYAKFCQAVFINLNNFSFQKSHQANVEYGTGSLVTGEGSTAVERWRRRLY